QLLSGLSQIHVEVAVDRLKSRFNVEVDLHQPRVPYLETIRKEARAQGRYKKQTGGRGQFGDCQIVIEPLDGHQGYEFVDQTAGGGGRSRERRCQLPPRPAAGQGTAGRDDDDQGRGADGRDPHLLAGAHVDDGRARRLPHAFPPLRGSPFAHRPEGHRRSEEGKGRSQGLMSDEKPPALEPELVHEFVLKAHSDLATVERLLEENSELLNSAWDWGAGDWETALGAASHVGRREIAEFLLQRGARMEIFAAALLGDTESVRAM